MRPPQRNKRLIVLFGTADIMLATHDENYKPKAFITALETAQ